MLHHTWAKQMQLYMHTHSVQTSACAAGISPNSLTALQHFRLRTASNTACLSNGVRSRAVYGMERATLRAAPATTCTVMSVNLGDAGHEELLRDLEGCSISKLRQHMSQHPNDVSLSFLQWLATREDKLTGSDKLRVAVLGGQLMALREGLDPSGFEDVADELQQQWSASEQQQQQLQHQAQQLPNLQQQRSSHEQHHSDASASDKMSPDPELFPSTPSSLQRSLPVKSNGNQAGLHAFSQAGIVRQYEQVQLLNLEVQQARTQSTVQIVGRKQVTSNDSLAMSSAAQRILEFLLSLPSAAARREILPEAFEMPENAAADQCNEPSDGVDPETEQLSTSPLQLLQAVDLELARLEDSFSAHSTSSKVLSSAGAMSDEDVRTALQQLRIDVLHQWDAT